MTWPQFAILNAAAAVVLAVVWWPRRHGELDVPESPRPPVPGAAASPPVAGSPAPGQRPAGTQPPAGVRQPGSHPPHNPFAPGTITFTKPCGCKRTVDEATRRTLSRFACDEAPHWDAWQRQVDAL